MHRASPPRHPHGGTHGGIRRTEPIECTVNAALSGMPARLRSAITPATVDDTATFFDRLPSAQIRIATKVDSMSVVFPEPAPADTAILVPAGDSRIARTMAGCSSSKTRGAGEARVNSVLRVSAVFVVRLTEKSRMRVSTASRASASSSPSRNSASIPQWPWWYLRTFGERILSDIATTTSAPIFNGIMQAPHLIETDAIIHGPSM